MQKDYILPGAILIGGAFIGLGLYFGLRERPVPAPSTAAHPAAPVPVPPPEPATAAATTSSSPQPEPGAPAALASAVAPRERSAVEADARTALLAEKKRVYVTTCWQPALAENPQPASASYVFSLSFDAQGHEIARGINEVRGKVRSDVAACLRKQPMGLRIPPPGASSSVEVSVDFP